MTLVIISMVVALVAVFLAGREHGKNLGVASCEPLLNRYHAMIETMLQNDDNATALLKSLSQDIEILKNQLYEINSQKHQ